MPGPCKWDLVLFKVCSSEEAISGQGKGRHLLSVYCEVNALCFLMPLAWPWAGSLLSGRDAGDIGQVNNEGAWPSMENCHIWRRNPKHILLSWRNGTSPLSCKRMLGNQGLHGFPKITYMSGKAWTGVQVRLTSHPDSPNPHISSFSLGCLNFWDS